MQTALSQLRCLSLVLTVGIGVDVLFLPLAGIRQLEAMQWRHRGKDSPGSYQRAHVAKEQCRQQTADVGTVGIGVGHEDDLAVTRRLKVEVAARASSDDLNDRAALGVFQHVPNRRFLYVEDLSPDGQQRLELRIPGQLGGAKSRVAFDNEQFGSVDVSAAAVDELGRQC